MTRRARFVTARHVTILEANHILVKRTQVRSDSRMYKRTARRLFPGGNTADGFVGFFSDIINVYEANRIYIIKGGPGVGKSSLMRRIGSFAEELGQPVEYFHCSSDPDSLDGVCLPRLRVAMMDGTAPHTVDPKAPGATDEIVNLGEYLDSGELAAHRNEINMLLKEIKRMFDRAYCYAAAAKRMRAVSAGAYSVDERGVLRLQADLTQRLAERGGFGPPAGRVRDFYLSAFTPKGHVKFISGVNADTVWKIHTPWGIDASECLFSLAKTARSYGMNVERCRCALNAGRADHLIIDGSLFITTDNGCHGDDVSADLDAALDPYAKLLDAAQAETGKELFDSMIDRMTDSLRSAKQLHNELEQYYIDAMDFDGVDMLFDGLASAIFQ